jgi:integrase
MKERTGFLVRRAGGQLYVRISFTDSLGKRRELMRRAKDKQHAKQLQKELSKQLDSIAAGGKVQAKPTAFKELAQQYASTKLIPAQYVNERKIAGRRSLVAPKIYIQRLISHFGNVKLSNITHHQIDLYRLQRLDSGLTIASVNRELELLRAVLNYAKREGLIERTPFEMGESLISKADETRRDRVMSLDEEEKVLAQCVDKRKHLKTLIIAAVDTGCRRGELFTLTWADVDLNQRVINIRAFNTKTMRARSVPISDRLAAEFERLRQSVESEDSANNLVFGISDNIKHSWTTATKKAGIQGLRFHDLRHTFCTRLIEAGMPIDEVAKLAGHTQINTTYKHYLNTTASTLDRARQALNKVNQ